MLRRFNNARLRMGLRRSGERFDVSMGLNVHAIRYHLDQENFVEEFRRDLNEHSMEWTFSTGLGVRFPEFEVRYLGVLTLGTGQPGIETLPGGWDVADALGAERAGYSGTFLVAPNGTLTLRETTVFTHQVAVIVPLLD